MTLTEKRRSLDMSLGECARAAGITSLDLSRVERGRAIPDEEMSRKIGSVLGLTGGEVAASLPSPEEVAEENARHANFVLAVNSCTADAKKHGLGRGNGGKGEIECPICKGRLRYSVAGLNGHIWGACENKDCVRWLQ